MSSFTTLQPLSSFQGVSGLPGASTNNNTFSIPTLGGLFSSDPNSVIGQFSSSLGLSNNSLGGQPAGTASASGEAGGGLSAATTATLSDLFLRSVVIILGFIFVAVGLSMFKNGGYKI